jgi:uncharacterized protein YxjI
MMKGESFSRDVSLLLPDGTALLRVDAKSMSLSRQMTVIDAVQGQELAIIRKDTSLNMRRRYYAETPDGSRRIFDTEVETSWSLKGGIMTLSCANVAAGGRPVQIQYKNETRFGVRGQVTWQEMPVAKIEKNSWKMSAQYQVQIAPGMDPFLVLAMAVIIEDLRKQNRSSTAPGGGGG